VVLSIEGGSTELAVDYMRAVSDGQVLQQQQPAAEAACGGSRY